MPPTTGCSPRTNSCPGSACTNWCLGFPITASSNGAFTHANPLGSRFSGPDRGAWYAAFEVETAQAEIAFHKTLQLAEIGKVEDDVTVDDYLADFSAELHDIRDGDFAEILNPESYVESQVLAERLLETGSLGIVYPSVRRDGGTCLSCFRPALVMNVRKGPTYRLRWSGGPIPAIEVLGPTRTGA